MKRLFLFFPLVLIAIAGWGGYIWIHTLEKGFPKLGPGLYIGTIRLNENKTVIPWIVERYNQEDEVSVLIADPRYAAQKVALHDLSESGEAPLIVNGEGSRLRFSGREGGASILEGTCIDPINNEAGGWALVRTTALGPLPSEQAAELISWAELRRELENSEAKLEQLRRESDDQRAKIDKLQRYVFDETALKETAESRLDSTASSIHSLRAEADVVRAKLDEALRQLETAERISPTGNLTLLSRESVQRDSRWVELSLRLLAPETTPGFEQALERAYRVQALQGKIAAERRKIRELEDAAAGQDYRGEEEFYREMEQ